MEREIINRVAGSALVTLDLESYYDRHERVVLDIKDWLYQETILREKDFRNYIKEHDWSAYSNKNVAITCSVDAIIPTWAFMLVAISLQPQANMVVYGDLQDLENALFQQALSTIDAKDYEGAKVVVKGCGNFPVPTFAYLEVVRLLTPVVSSIMYGEPCSTVPLYKKKIILK